MKKSGNGSPGPQVTHWSPALSLTGLRLPQHCLASGRGEPLGPDTASICQRGSENTSGLGVLLEPRGADKQELAGDGEHEASA